MAYFRLYGQPEASGDLAISSLSASHDSIGEELTIYGTNFGSTQGDSAVYFGELPVYTWESVGNADATQVYDGYADEWVTAEYGNYAPYVMRPLAEEAASYVSWSDTQIVVTVPSMSPGLPSTDDPSRNTAHPVYVEVGGEPSDAVDFYIDPVLVVDGSIAISGGKPTDEDISALFPTSDWSLEDNTYPNSEGSRHSSYSTHLVIDGNVNYQNLTGTNIHDVLFKDVTFSSSYPGTSQATGVIQFAFNTAHYNLTFHNCVIANNLKTTGEGSNWVKYWASQEATARQGNWTFSDCSFGTPNSPGGSVRRFGCEFNENGNGGLAEGAYDTECYLHNVQWRGCDFEPCGCIPISLGFYGWGPERGMYIDDCLFKGARHDIRVEGMDLGTGIIEESGRGLVITNTTIWPNSTSGMFRMEGTFDGGGVSGLYMTGTNPHWYMENVNVEDNRYMNLAPNLGTTRLLYASDWYGLVWRNSDIDFGDSDYYIRIMGYDTSLITFYDIDMSGSYVHGYCLNGLGNDVYDYYRYGAATDPATYFAANGWTWPTFGVKP